MSDPTKSKSAVNPEEQEAQEYYATYTQHSQTLRIWLVAYGAGVPAIIAASSTLSDRLFCTGFAGIIAALFLFGASLQVGLAFLNKHLMWAMYSGAADATFKETWAYKQADKHASKYWIDVLVDATTVLVFAVATWFTLLAAVDKGCLAATVPT